MIEDKMKKFDHISTETILKDIRDTERENVNYEKRLYILHERISERKAFIKKLNKILKYRERKMDQGEVK